MYVVANCLKKLTEKTFYDTHNVVPIGCEEVGVGEEDIFVGQLAVEYHCRVEDEEDKYEPIGEESWPVFVDVGLVGACLHAEAVYVEGDGNTYDDVCNPHHLGFHSGGDYQQ